MHLSREQWLDLAAERGSPHVTLTLPLEHDELTLGKNRIRLKNLLAEADERLGHLGLSPPDREALLRPGRELLAQEGVAEEGARGLVVLLGGERPVVHWCRHELDATVRVADRFDLSPILDHLLPAPAFWVLALSGNGHRLLRCKPDGVKERELPSAPRDLAKATMFDDMPMEHRPRHAHRVGGTVGGDTGNPRNIGQGFGHEQRSHIELEEYLRGVEAAIRKDVGELDGPLVLACVDRAHGMWRELFGDDACFPQRVDGHPDRRGDEELRDAAWALVKDSLQPDGAAEVDRYFQAQHEGRTANDLHALLQAAENQRVDTLFWCPNGPLWAHFGPDGAVERVNPGSEDAVDLTAQLVAWTLRNGGDVVRVDRLPEPDGDPGFNAILRW